MILPFSHQQIWKCQGLFSWLSILLLIGGRSSRMNRWFLLRILSNTAVLFLIWFVSVRKKEFKRSIFLKTSDVVKKVADYKLISIQEDSLDHLAYCICFFNVQQCQINLKISVYVANVVDKSLLVSLYQGNRGFGNTAGIHCACNSLYILCWSNVRKGIVWNGFDFDHVLVEGDLLYHSTQLICSKLINYQDQLYDKLQLYDFSVSVTFFGGRGYK